MEVNESHAKILGIVPNTESSALGRAWCLWLILKHLGMEFTVIGLGHGVWEPLRGHAFERDVRPLAGWRELMAYDVGGFDLVMPVKAQAYSLGTAYLLTRGKNIPLLLDVDDPDLEVQCRRFPGVLGIGGPEDRKLLARWRVIPCLRRWAKPLPKIVSNPGLLRWYDGAVVPHVRVPDGTVADSELESDEVTVGFVGSPRRHKGVAALRKAVRLIEEDGFRLLMTAEEPGDAAPWERWVGRTSVAEGQKLLRGCHIAAVPSSNSSYACGQLPVKMIDAMMWGRPVVGSDVPPIRWALDGGGVLVRPKSVRSIASGLLELRDRAVRERCGAMGADSARRRFTPEAVGPTMEYAVKNAIAR